MNSKKHLTKIFVLRTIKYKESDLIVHGLTQENGKMTFIARGALRSKKRFGGGVLEPTHHVLVSYTSAHKEGVWPVLLEAQLLHDFKGLRQSYDRLDLALKVLDAITKVSQENDPHSQDLYNLVGHSLQKLELESNLETFKVHFYIRFLLQQGVLNFKSWMQVFVETPMASELNVSKLENALLKDLISQFETYVSRAESDGKKS